jgi:hypothetical protein
MNKIGSEYIKTINEAWRGMKQSFYVERPKGSKPCKENNETVYKSFKDFENEFALLKDVDALTTLIEPFLLARSDFFDPPLELLEYKQLLTQILNERKCLMREYDSEEKAKIGTDKYLGFSASPYPFQDSDYDYVDSAAGILRLMCNALGLAEYGQSVSKDRTYLSDLSEDIISTALESVDFLISSAIEDSKGARWTSMNVNNIEGEIATAYRESANLFFTRYASLALLKAINTEKLADRIGAEKRDIIKRLLQQVLRWTDGQADVQSPYFWMDDARRMNSPVFSSMYATEIIYSLSGSQVNSNTQKHCLDSLKYIFKDVRNVNDMATKQSDIYYTVPDPFSKRMILYNDRGYVGGFLTTLTLIKKQTPEAFDAELERVGKVVLDEGLVDDWIDEPTKMWDDGYPFICDTFEAMLGIINYAKGGIIKSYSIRETMLGAIIQEALTSREVVDQIVSQIVKRIGE